MFCYLTILSMAAALNGNTASIHAIIQKETNQDREIFWFPSPRPDAASEVSFYSLSLSTSVSCLCGDPRRRLDHSPHLTENCAYALKRSLSQMTLWHSIKIKFVFWWTILSGNLNVFEYLWILFKENKICKISMN